MKRLINEYKNKYRNKYRNKYSLSALRNIALIILAFTLVMCMSGCGESQSKGTDAGSDINISEISNQSSAYAQDTDDKLSETKAITEDEEKAETETETEDEEKAKTEAETWDEEKAKNEAETGDEESTKTEAETWDNEKAKSEAETEDEEKTMTEATPEPDTPKEEDNRITICIDPGHGGSNEGTKETYDGVLIKEKNVTMAIARKLKYYLEQNDNIRVVMTRDSDYSVSLAGRIEYAAEQAADYVISMHINSKSTDELDAHGCMVLMSCSRYQTDNARFGSIYDKERTLAYSILSKLNGIGIPIANDSWNGNEYKDGILQRYNTAGELYPDGSVADYYGLINEGTCAGIPTIIVEHAFLSNESDYRNYLSTDVQLDALARADAAGIIEAVLK